MTPLHIIASYRRYLRRHTGTPFFVRHSVGVRARLDYGRMASPGQCLLRFSSFFICIDRTAIKVRLKWVYHGTGRRMTSHGRLNMAVVLSEYGSHKMFATRCARGWVCCVGEIIVTIASLPCRVDMEMLHINISVASKLFARFSGCLAFKWSSLNVYQKVTRALGEATCGTLMPLTVLEVLTIHCGLQVSRCPSVGCRLHVSGH